MSLLVLSPGGRRRSEPPTTNPNGQLRRIAKENNISCFRSNPTGFCQRKKDKKERSRSPTLVFLVGHQSAGGQRFDSWGVGFCSRTLRFKREMEEATFTVAVLALQNGQQGSSWRR
ncbi:hypothetical protein GQ457_06G010270 [Hibiscus cannabinus]